MNEWIADLKYPFSWIKHPVLCTWLANYHITVLSGLKLFLTVVEGSLCHIPPHTNRTSPGGMSTSLPGSSLPYSSACTNISALEISGLTAHLNLPWRVKRQHGILTENLVSEMRLPGLKSCFHHFLTLWPWLIVGITYLFEFLISEMWIIRTPMSWGHREGLNKLI